MKVSIIIPIYNVEPYVGRCLESVMSQAVAGVDVECIVVDDCGQDRSMDIVRQLVADYQGPIRFYILRHEQNRGLSAARNTGLAAATGDYVLFMDSDDYLMPDSIQYFLDHLRQYPDVDMLMGNVRNCKDGTLLIRDIQEPRLLDDADVFISDLLHHHIYQYAWNKLIRRSVLTDNDILFEEGILYEDQLWSYQLFQHLSAVLLLPRVTYVYENNASSIVNTTFTREKADWVLWSYTRSSDKVLDCPPRAARYRRDMTVDYLFYAFDMLMRASDIIPYGCTEAHLSQFRAARRRLMACAWHAGRLLLLLFFLLLYPPFSLLKRWGWFRRHYYQIEQAWAKLCHAADFLHHSK